MYSNSIETKQTWRTRVVNNLISFAFTTGLHRISRLPFSKSLTVINYHRIDNPYQPDFDSFQPNISATPDMFNQQMDYLARWFNVISMQDLLNWLHGKQPLPHHAVLITFDDGYLDNYTQAYPILRQHNFPAVIFLTTGHIGTNAPFYWDLAAHCFHHTDCDHIQFPNGTEKSWTNSAEKKLTGNAWIESLKSLPDDEKQDWVERLPHQLQVSIPIDYFRNLMMNWDQIREMNKNGIEFGGHTVNHPILSRISLDQAIKEIKGSKERIENELGQNIFSFAYPNGMRNDLNLNIELLVAQAGYQAAFTLLNGPAMQMEVKRNPYAIRRIFISHTHQLSHFAILTNYVNRYRK